MSYCRWTEDSDVYVYLDTGGALRCCGCDFGDEWAYTTDDMIAHLKRHREAGHQVPQYAIDRLLVEREEIDAWIRGEAEKWASSEEDTDGA